MVVKSDGNSEKIKTYECWLFSDILIVGVRKEKKHFEEGILVLKAWLALVDCQPVKIS